MKKTPEFPHIGDQVHVSNKGQTAKNSREITFFYLKNTAIIVANIKDIEILQSVN